MRNDKLSLKNISYMFYVYIKCRIFGNNKQNNGSNQNNSGNNNPE